MAPLILPVCTPREGSSLVVSIFVAHGLWVGSTEPRNGWGYRNFENIEVKNAIRAYYPNPTGHNYSEPRFDLRGFVEGLRGDQPAIIKTFINLYPIWFAAYPDAEYFGVLRDLDGAIASLIAKGHTDKALVGDMTAYRHDQIEQLGYPVVRTDELIAGEYTTLAAAFEHCEMHFEPDIARDIIKVDKWHH